MPDEGMPLDLHAIALTERDDRVAGAEVVAAPRAFDGIPFHFVLGGQVVEMTAGDPGVAPVGEQAGLNGGAHELSGCTRAVAQRLRQGPGGARRRSRRRGRRGDADLLPATPR